jgi:tetratricopeptide (TPR) repeat protein
MLMLADPIAAMARELRERADQLQRQGDLDLAVDLYRRSISLHPTAEAHTFLGWTYRFQGRVQDAIAECKRAIDVDPSLGNPYNDIGTYLIELGKVEDSIPWLEKAIRSQRYQTYHYPWYNLGRAYTQLELYSMARSCFQRALDIQPGYAPAREALERLRRLIQ